MNLESFNQHLLRIGGRSSSGYPRLRCVSALTETKFACGGVKAKYPASSKTEERWLWGLRDNVSGVVTAKSEEDARANTDPQKSVVKKFLGRKVTWFGYPNFVVEYYRSPGEMKDTSLNWWQNRYGWWKNPETRLMEWTDINGEFPVHGRYDLLFVVKKDDGTAWGQPCELTQKWLQEAVRVVASHAEFRKVNTDEEMIRHMVEAQETREDRAEAEIADAVEQEIGSEWRRMLKNNPRVFYSNLKPNEKGIGL